jgi:hypothetical protein
MNEGILSLALYSNIIERIIGSRYWRCLKTVLRRIFGQKKDECIGKWRKKHNEALHNLYSSPNIIRQIKSRRMRWAGHVARMGDDRKVYRVLVGKPEGKRSL